MSERLITAAGQALYDSLRRGVVFVVARKADGSEFPDYALPAILAIEAEAAALDVERLAGAYWMHRESAHQGPPHLICQNRCIPLIAAAYARLEPDA